MPTQLIEMTIDRETKNKVVYEATESGVVVDGVYAWKNKLPAKPPAVIRVTVDYDE